MGLTQQIISGVEYILVSDQMSDIWRRDLEPDNIMDDRNLVHASCHQMSSFQGHRWGGISEKSEVDEDSRNSENGARAASFHIRNVSKVQVQR